jgi:DNA helicase II / ATP-dependent DNA helicase PcrA
MSPLNAQHALDTLTQGLNSEQTSAVKHFNGPALVLAGAGSGKTRVLIHRIAALIAQGIPAHQILALTFTNKAAQEMKERVNEYTQQLGINQKQQVTLSTFHSFTALFLRRYADQVGRSSAFMIYDQDDQLKLLKSVIAQQNLSLEREDLLDLYEAIEYAKNRGKPASQIDLTLYQGLSQKREIPAHKIAQAYDEALQHADAFDFADLIRIPIQILENPEILTQTRARWPWILVDEFQDTNQAQLMLLQKLCPSQGNLFVVGDEDQSIYSWRGAEIQNILQFHHHYPQAHRFKLQQNYRSSKNILHVANRVIRQNQQRIGKELWTQSSQGKPIYIYHAESDRDEADYVVNEIDQLIQKGVRCQEIAILYRANHLTLNFETAFQKKLSIPYTILRGLSFFERAEVKDALAYLRLLINPRDQIAFQRACGTPSRGIGAVSLKHAGYISTDEQVHLFEAARRACQRGLIKGKAKQGFHTLYELYTEGEYLQQTLMSQQAESLLIQAGIYIPHKLQDVDDEQRRSKMENIQRLIEHIQEYAQESDVCTWTNYLEKVHLIDDVSQKTQASGTVSLMTVHACKGLEFPYVFVVGLEDGLFPHNRSKNKSELKQAQDLEEERRLFYVALTRAEKRLWVSYAGRRGLFGQSPRLQDPSMFLQEMEGSEIQHIYPSRLSHWKRNRKESTGSSSKKHHAVYSESTPNHQSKYKKKRYTQSNHTSARSTNNQVQMRVQRSHSNKESVPHQSSTSTSVPSTQTQQNIKVGDHQFHVGQFVVHKTFGVGKVLSINRRSARYHAQVQFKGRARSILIDFLKPQYTSP